MAFKDLSRRDFLRLSAVAGAGLALPGGASLLHAQQDLIQKNIQKDLMSYVPFGRTKMLISRLSIGGAPWNVNVAQAAVAQGLNLVHGSMNYGTMPKQSEALKGLWDKVFFVLKGEVSAKNVDDTLKILGRDYVDMILPVFKTPVTKDQNAKIEESFAKLKQAGKVRFLGSTIHIDKMDQSIKDILDTVIAAKIYDATIIMYPPEKLKEILPSMKKAREDGIGILSMKTLQGIGPQRRRRGQQQQQEQQQSAEEILAAKCKAIESALTKEGCVHSVNKSLNTFEELKNYSAVAKKMKADWAGQRLTEKEIKEMVDPSVCGACAACEAVCEPELALQGIMRCQTYYDQAEDEYARMMYREIPPQFTAVACKDCGSCETACPRGLPIRQHLRQAAQRWG